MVSKSTRINPFVILIIAVLFFFSFGELLRFQLSESSAITLNDVGVLGVVLIWVIKKITGRRNDRYLYTVPILLFAGLALLSLLINGLHLNLLQLFNSFLYLVRWVFYASLYFVVSDLGKEQKEKISKTLLIVGSVITLGGYIQYILYPNLRNLYYLGWDEHLYRLFSSFLDPNFAGCFFVLFLLFTLSFLFDKKRKNSLAYGLIAILDMGALFLTYSRSAYLMFLISSLVFLTLLNKKKLIVGFLFIGLIFLFASSRLFKSEGTNLLRTTSSLTRVSSSEQALVIAKDYPVFGVGFDAYGFAQKKYGFLKSNKGIVNHAAFGADNSLLFVLATTGIAGFISYLFMWAFILKEQLKSKTLLSVVIIASIIGVFVDSFFINSLFYPFVMEWMWLLLGLRENM